MPCRDPHPWTSSTGRGVTVAVVDSGVFAGHPHVGAVAGGVAVSPDGTLHDDYVDRLGHGTAVAAAIREKSPDATLAAVKIFDRTLSASVEQLVGAIDWAVEAGVTLVNLSLGTRTTGHGDELARAVERALDAGVAVVAARADHLGAWFPGSLPGVIAVEVDWGCPREEFRVAVDSQGRVSFRASGLPRSIPGVPPERNLKGVSFAVANVSGFVARACERLPRVAARELPQALVDNASSLALTTHGPRLFSYTSPRAQPAPVSVRRLALFPRV